MAALPPITDSFLQAVVGSAGTVGMDPLDLLRVWYAESGINPQNWQPGSSDDTSYAGINALNWATLKGWGITPSEYVTRDAEGQLPVVLRDVKSREDGYFHGKPFPDYAVYEAANLLPARIGDGSDTTVLSRSPERFYVSNRGIDVGGKGYITIADVRAFVDRRTKEPRFQDVLRRLNVTGASAPPSKWPLVLGIAGAATVAGVGLYFWKPWRRYRMPHLTRSEKYLLAGGGALAATTVAGVAYALSKPKTSSRFGRDVVLRARTDVGIRETSPNSSARIDAMLANVGAPPGVNWCAAAVSTWIDEAAFDDSVKRPVKGSAGALNVADQFGDASNPRVGWWTADDLRTQPSRVQAGSVVVWRRGPTASRLGHIGVVETSKPDGSFISIEGNSGTAADGVYRWAHDLSSDALYGMGYFVDSAIFSGVAQTAGYALDPPAVRLFPPEPE